MGREVSGREFPSPSCLKKGTSPQQGAKCGERRFTLQVSDAAALRRARSPWATMFTSVGVIVIH